MLHIDIYKHFTGKVYVFTNSVLCLGGAFPQQESGNKTESAISSQLQNTENWTTSMENRCVFEWKIFPGHTSARDPIVDGE